MKTLEDILSNNEVLTLDELTSDQDLVKEIQTRLSEIGLLQLSDVDGVFGSITKSALSRFCDVVDLNNMSTGLFGSTFAKKLIEFRGPIGIANFSNFNSSEAVKDRLATALKFTLAWEGGFVNDPRDLGGATNKGITQRTYNSYRIKNRLPTKSVQLIVDSEVHEIYHEMYWKPCQAELMELPLAIVQFDTAVLFGVGGAIKFLQEALEITADGIFGPQTKEVMEANNNIQTARTIIERRIAFHNRRVQQNSSQRRFLQGWLNRVNQVSPKKTIGLQEFIKSL